MSYYDSQVGACGPVGCAPGGWPYGNPGYGYGGYPGYAPLVSTFPTNWDIVGADPVGPQKSFFDQAKEFGQKESIAGIKNQNLLLGAAALGGIFYGWTQGWLGGGRRARR